MSFCAGRPSAQPVELEKLGDGAVGQTDQKHYIDKTELLSIYRYEGNATDPIYYSDLPARLRLAGNSTGFVVTTAKQNGGLRKRPQEPEYAVLKLSGQ